jgi:hypothetical protein
VITSQESSGIGKQDATYARDVTKALQGTTGAFLLNIALQRVPDTEPLPHERMEAIAALSKSWHRERLACSKQYGNNEEAWPVTACPEYRLLKHQYTSAIGKYTKTVRTRVQFDDPPRIDEAKWKYPALQGRKQTNSLAQS